MSDTLSSPEPAAVPAGPVLGIHPRTVDGGEGWNWIASAWDLFVKSPGVWIVNVIIMLCIWFVLQFIPLVGQLAAHLMWPIFIGGLMLGCRALDRGEKFEVAHLFAGFKSNTSQLLMVGVFMLVAGLIIAGVVILIVLVAGGGTFLAALWGGSAAGLLAGGTFLMLALFGMLVATLLAIPLFMAAWFAPPLIMFGNLAAVDAMRISFNACLKNVVPFLIYGLVMIILMIVASIPAFLGWLALLPVMIASVYTGYRDIFTET
jgi:uncharacterized membrane protein